MTPQLRLIFVHGISAEVVRGDYTTELCDLLRAKLTANGVIPANATQDQIDAIVTFEHVNYSDVGQTEEDGVLASYRQERGKLYSLPDDALELIAYDKVRAQMITAVSDCLVYESAVQRDEIRKRLLDAVTPYVGSGDAVSIVGHSLGSVVAFDTAYFNSRHNDAWLKAGFKPTNLFTMGSPIALFSMEMDDTTGQQKPRYLPAGGDNALAPAGDLQPNLAEGVWYNFLDAQDLIAYPLETLFTGKFQVKDFRVETGLLPISAHTGYWRNADVADRIAQRLKLDLARVQAPAAINAREQVSVSGSDPASRTGRSSSTDLSEIADRYLTGAVGTELINAGPVGAKLWSVIGNETTTRPLVASVYWAALAYSSAFARLLEAAGIRLPVLAGAGSGSGPAAPIQEPGRRQTMIVPHAQRFDLIVLDADYNSSTPWSDRVKVGRDQLLEGWARVVAETRGYPVDRPPVGRQTNWMEHIAIEKLGEVAAEVNAVAEFAVLVTRLPPLLQTATCPSPLWAVEDEASTRLATAGVFATNGEGRGGVTTANHAIPHSIRRVLVNGSPGTVGKRDPVSDSCFIETEPMANPVSRPTLVPLRGVSPRAGEDVDFEGLASGQVTTRVQAWDVLIPFVVEPWIQLSVRTKVVTNAGDSGAALLDRSGHVIGFSSYRTGFGSEIEFSAWIWAESVFSVHGLR